MPVRTRRSHTGGGGKSLSLSSVWFLRIAQKKATQVLGRQLPDLGHRSEAHSRSGGHTSKIGR